MKKRVLMFALVMGMLLSACSSVWAAAANYSKLDCVAAAYKVKHNVDAEAGSTFSIPIQGQVIAISNTGTGYESGKPTSITFSFTPSPAESFAGVSIVDTTIPINNITDADGYFYTTKIKGTVKGNGTITVTGSVTIGGKTQEESAIIEFTTQPGNDVMDSAFVVEEPYEEATKVDPSTVTEKDPGADPDADNFDGLPPTFGEKGGNNKDKPTIATSKPVFTGTGYTGNEKALKSGVPATFEIKIKGPGPLIDVYVSAKDAKKLWPLECDPKLGGKEPTENISLTQENIKKWKIPFRVTEATLSTAEEQDKTTEHTLKIAYNGAQVAYKGFPITVSVENDKTGTKPVTKTYKIDIVSDKQVPQWVTPGGVVGENLTKKNADEIPVSLSDGGSLGSVIYTVSADGPYYITSKGGKLGMSADAVQPELNRFGEVVTPGYVKVYGKFDNGDKGTKGGTKEVKEAFTLDAVGSVKKVSFKPTVVGKVSPYFDPKNLVSSADKDTSYAGLPKIDKTDYEGYYKVKTAEAGKAPSVKIAAKGSKTIEYSILPEEESKLNAFGLTFNGAKGQVEQLVGDDGKKVSTTATIDESGEYAPIELNVTADNGVGTATVKALVGVTGAKAKPYLGKGEDNKEIKTLLIPQNAEVGEYFTVYALVGKEEAGDHDNVHFRLADAKNAKEGKTELNVGEDTYALENLGLEFIPSSEFETEFGDDKIEYRNLGVFKVVSTLKAVKSQKVNLIVSNLGNEQKGAVTIAIVDPTPEISGSNAIEVAPDGQKKTFTYTLSAGAPTNGAKITWNIATKPDSKTKLSAKLSNPKVDGVTNYSTATLEVTAKADATDGTLTITAENADSKLKSEPFEVTITVASAGGGEEGGDNENENQSAPNTKKGKGAPAGDVSSKPENEDENESEEADALEFGAQRTADQLTAGQKAFLAEKGYTVVAVLPEVKATADGQYEFEVELDEDAPEGAKLIWLAFPKDAEENEDDKIADFYDKSGEAIEEVPAGKVIVVAPWPRADVTYQPVIAVEN
jgi:hypothetical protein